MRCQLEVEELANEEGANSLIHSIEWNGIVVHFVEFEFTL